MSTPGPVPTGTTTPSEPEDWRRHLTPFWQWLNALGVRRSEDRWIGGVAGGVAARWGVDPLLVRGLFVAACVLGGVGFFAYGVCWALLPEPDGRIHAREALAGRFEQGQLGAGAMIFIGLPASNTLDWNVGWVGGVLKGLGWLALVAAGLWWANLSRKRHAEGATESPGRGGGGLGDGGGGLDSAGSTGAGAGAGSTGAGAVGASSTLPTNAASTSGSIPVWGTPEPFTPSTSPPAASTATPALPSAPAPLTAWDAAAASGTGASVPAAQKAKEAKPKRSPRGPGRVLASCTLAVAALAVATLLVGDRIGWWTAGAPLVVGTILAVLGLGIVVAGLAGRRGGWLTACAIIAGVVGFAIPVSGYSGVTWDESYENSTLLGHSSWTPTTVSEASAGLQVGAGDAVVDLTSLPLTAGESVVVPIRVGVGSAVVTVPDGVAVRATTSTGVGEVTWDVDGTQASAKGPMQRNQTFGASESEAELILDIQVGAGTVVIEGASS